MFNLSLTDKGDVDEYVGSGLIASPLFKSFLTQLVNMMTYGSVPR